MRNCNSAPQKKSPAEAGRSRVDPAGMVKPTGSTRLRVEVSFRKSTSGNWREKAPHFGGAKFHDQSTEPAYRCAALAQRGRSPRTAPPPARCLDRSQQRHRIDRCLPDFSRAVSPQSRRVTVCIPFGVTRFRAPAPLLRRAQTGLEVFPRRRSERKAPPKRGCQVSGRPGWISHGKPSRPACAWVRRQKGPRQGRPNHA